MEKTNCPHNLSRNTVQKRLMGWLVICSLKGFKSLLPSHLLKSLKGLALILIFAFSFSSYSRYGKDPGKGASKEIRIQEKAKFFNQNIAPYFMNGNFFKSDEASQSFQAECEGSYVSFKSNVQQYQNYYHKSTTPDQLLDMYNLLESVKASMKQCGNKIYKSYTNLHARLMDGLKKTGFHSPDSLASVLGVNNSFPERVKRLEQFLSDWRYFRKNCLQQVQYAGEDQYVMKSRSSFTDKTFGEIMEQLQTNECPIIRKKLENPSKERKAFDKFVNLPELCMPQTGAGCIQDLRSRLKPVAQQQSQYNTLPNTLPSLLSKSKSWANECCLTASECKYFPQAKQNYQSILQSSGQDVCRAGNTQALNQFKNKTWEICQKASQQCQQNVAQDLDKFRTDFLECFFLPDTGIAADRIHARNGACKGQIQDIRKEFAKAFENRNPQVALQNLPGGNRLDHTYILVKECEAPLEQLRKNSGDLLNSRSSGTLSAMCDERRKSHQASLNRSPNSSNSSRHQSAQSAGGAQAEIPRSSIFGQNGKTSAGDGKNSGLDLLPPPKTKDTLKADSSPGPEDWRYGKGGKEGLIFSADKPDPIKAGIYDRLCEIEEMCHADQMRFWYSKEIEEFESEDGENMVIGGKKALIDDALNPYRRETDSRFAHEYQPSFLDRLWSRARRAGKGLLLTGVQAGRRMLGYKPLKKPYTARDLQEEFNIHGPEVNLWDRHFTMLVMGCILHPDCINDVNYELVPPKYVLDIHERVWDRVPLHELNRLTPEAQKNLSKRHQEALKRWRKKNNISSK